MNVFFVEPVIRQLPRGRLLREVFAAVLKGLAVLAALTALWQFFKLFDAYPYLSFGEKIAYFLFANLLTLAAAGLVFGVLWVRSEDIRRDESPDYPAVAIFRHLAHAGGEAFAAMTVVGGLSTMALVWLKLYPCQLAAYLPDLNLGLRPEEPFWAGLLVLVQALIGASLVLFVAYLAAELVSVLADIARNTRGGPSGEKG